jgi:hypothetical protein
MSELDPEITSRLEQTTLQDQDDAGATVPLDDRTDSTPYQYQPLPEDNLTHIRLMKVLHPQKDNGGIHIIIESFVLEDAPQFTALSYLWGNPERDIPILANGNHFGITRSVCAFFRETHRRLQQDDACSRTFHGWLWIDAICINQDDLRERSKQVTHMQAIFEKAHDIIIWLGEATAKSEEAYDAIRKLGTAEAPDSHLYNFRILDDETRAYEIFGPDLAVPLEVSTSWALSATFCCKYWSRSWILQEASTPKASPSSTWVCTGALSISLEEYMTANQRVIYASWGGPPNSPVVLHGVSNDEIGFVRSFRRSRSMKPAVDRAYFVLMRTRKFECTDVRDKMYAVLGLIDDVGELKLQPDYEMDVAKVYTQVTRAVIESSGSLDVLGSAGIVRKHDVPSWVADWSCTYNDVPMPFHSHDRVWGPNESISHETPIYFASKGMGSTEIGFDMSGRKLVVTGFTFDTIENVAPPRHWPDDEEANVWQEWLAIVRNLGETYVSGCPILEAFAKLLYADLATSYDDWSGDRPHTPNIELLESTDLFKANHRILNLMTWTRTICTTKMGYLGLTAWGAQVGDVVCVLEQSQMPVVLRPVDEEWVFVGQAYVHGIMDGEAVGMHGDQTVKTYTIR